ncbi:DUF1800 domain-containing protein [Aquirufa aurantiipilula]|uniref:DUF1800 domain-containing protein n=1 Tax=Aquirufa aurantiipilula TaxID=2696561 RepID=UPI0021D46241|nr:DUF1800 domain-containing protein [Aquirufa aurantiipilula]
MDTMLTWNTTHVSHLLSRVLFGYSKSDLERAMGYGNFQDLLDLAILKDIPNPSPPDTWVDLTPEQAQLDRNLAGPWFVQLTKWWYGRMFNESLSMQEKMVLFLHNHFSNERQKVNYPQYVYKQNQLFRTYAFGDFKQLVKDISIDPSMLIYLDGNNSRGTSPNENYAREVMELFTLGIGNYTENDIKQAARVFSGWQVKGLVAVFDATRWYREATVTVLGKSAKFDNNSLIDHIFTQTAAAEFICRKIYKEFVYYKADEVFVKKMAVVLRQNNFVLKPLLKFLFTSEEFYKPEIMAAKIKSPTELIVGSAKQLELKNPDLQNWYDMAIILQMQLFQPPNVAGWEGQRDWISSTTYSYRSGFTDSLLSGKRYNGATVTGKLDPIAFARLSSNAEKPKEFVEEMVKLFIRFPLTESRKAFLLEVLLDGTIAANWSTYTPNADARINKFLKAMMRLPEYQLA